MYREQGWNPKLQSGKPSEISRDTVVFQQWEHAYYYHASFIDEFSEWRRKTLVYFSISNTTYTTNNNQTKSTHLWPTCWVHNVCCDLFFISLWSTLKNIPSGVDGRSQGLWCRVWSSVHGQRHHVAGDQRCPGDGKYSNTWDNLCRWCWWLCLIIAIVLLLHFDVPHFVFNTQQTQVQGKQQLQVFMWFFQSFNTIYLISEGWPHNPTDSHGTIGRYEKDFNEAQWDWVVDATGYKQSDWSTMWVWKGCGFPTTYTFR